MGYLVMFDSSSTETVVRSPSFHMRWASCVLAMEKVRPLHAFRISHDLVARDGYDIRDMTVTNHDIARNGVT